MNLTEKPPKILVIDDEEQIRRALKTILSCRNYQVEFAATGLEGINKVIDLSPDLIILDISLPDLTGFEVCQKLRDWFKGPILILSVHGAEADKVKALDLGADDYLQKPFSTGELLARIRALLRRANTEVVPIKILQNDDLIIDIAHRFVKVKGQDISLTPTEFDILKILVLNVNCVVTTKMLIEKVWGDYYQYEIPTLRVHIYNLRKKIEQNSSIPAYIKTEPGVGFRFCWPD